jgi:hypothetical protein
MQICIVPLLEGISSLQGRATEEDGAPGATTGPGGSMHRRWGGWQRRTELRVLLPTQALNAPLRGREEEDNTSGAAACTRCSMCRRLPEAPHHNVFAGLVVEGGTGEGSGRTSPQLAGTGGAGEGPRARRRLAGHPCSPRGASAWRRGDGGAAPDLTTPSRGAAETVPVDGLVSWTERRSVAQAVGRRGAGKCNCDSSVGGITIWRKCKALFR